jgi:hypothetical protein
MPSGQNFSAFAEQKSKRAGEGASGRAGGGGACPRNWQELGDLIVNGASMQSGDDRAHDRALLHWSPSFNQFRNCKKLFKGGAPKSFFEKNKNDSLWAL